MEYLYIYTHLYLHIVLLLPARGGFHDFPVKLPACVHVHQYKDVHSNKHTTTRW